MKEGIDYVFVEHSTANFYSIKIKSGKFEGVIYTYGKVSFAEDKSNDNLKVSFDFRIEDVNESRHTLSFLENDDEFKNYIGDILSSILEQEFHIGKIDEPESDNDNTEESYS
jgi:hypothetical protein